MFLSKVEKGKNVRPTWDLFEVVIRAVRCMGGEGNTRSLESNNPTASVGNEFWPCWEHEYIHGY